MPIQQWSDSIWIAQLGNEPALSEDLSLLKNQSERQPRRPDVVLDLSAVTQVNSSNLSQLLRLRKAATDGDARLILASIPDSVWAVFLTTGLDKVFDFAQDVATALATLQMNRPKR